jgi:beta-lactamase regulating signal transducer with metallopeptidase domain
MKNQTQPKSQSLTYGVIYGLSSAVVLYLFYKLDVQITGVSSLVNLAIAAVCVLVPVNFYKSTNANQLNIANALKIGLVVGLIGGLIYAIYVYFHYSSIDDSMLVRVSEEMENARAEMKQQNPQLTDEQVEQAISITKMMASAPAVAIFKFIGALLETFFAALLIGLIKKSN